VLLTDVNVACYKLFGEAITTLGTLLLTLLGTHGSCMYITFHKPSLISLE